MYITTLNNTRPYKMHENSLDETKNTMNYDKMNTTVKNFGNATLGLNIIFTLLNLSIDLILNYPNTAISRSTIFMIIVSCLVMGYSLLYEYFISWQGRKWALVGFYIYLILFGFAVFYIGMFSCYNFCCKLVEKFNN